jgi:hypothetical protein
MSILQLLNEHDYDAGGAYPVSDDAALPFSQSLGSHEEGLALFSK